MQSEVLGVFNPENNLYFNSCRDSVIDGKRVIVIEWTKNSDYKQTEKEADLLLIYKAPYKLFLIQTITLEPTHIIGFPCMNFETEYKVQLNPESEPRDAQDALAEFTRFFPDLICLKS